MVIGIMITRRTGRVGRPPDLAPRTMVGRAGTRERRSSPVQHWALVDANVLPALDEHHWLLRAGYPVRLSGVARPRRLALHHCVLPLRTDVYVDHVNGNRLDARRENLRYATNSLNQANRRAVRTLAGFKGVTWHKQVGRWQAAVEGVTGFISA